MLFDAPQAITTCSLKITITKCTNYFKYKTISKVGSVFFLEVNFNCNFSYS